MLKVVAATSVGGLLSFDSVSESTIDLLLAALASRVGIITTVFLMAWVEKPKMDACHLIIGNWDSLLIGSSEGTRLMMKTN